MNKVWIVFYNKEFIGVYSHDKTAYDFIEKDIQLNSERNYNYYNIIESQVI